MNNPPVGFIYIYINLNHSSYSEPASYDIVCPIHSMMKAYILYQFLSNIRYRGQWPPSALTPGLKGRRTENCVRTFVDISKELCSEWRLRQGLLPGRDSHQDSTIEPLLVGWLRSFWVCFLDEKVYLSIGSYSIDRGDEVDSSSLDVILPTFVIEAKEFCLELQWVWRIEFVVCFGN